METISAEESVRQTGQRLIPAGRNRKQLTWAFAILGMNRMGSDPQRCFPPAFQKNRLATNPIKEMQGHGRKELNQPPGFCQRTRGWSHSCTAPAPSSPPCFLGSFSRIRAPLNATSSPVPGISTTALPLHCALGHLGSSSDPHSSCFGGTLLLQETTHSFQGA